MKISLRKANAIQQSINEAIQGLDLETTISINEFESVDSKIGNSLAKFLNNEEIRENLLEALFEIRAAVSAANGASGINGLLSILAKNEKQISFYRNLSKLQPMTEKRVLNGKIRKIAERDTDAIYGHSNEVQTTIFESDVIEHFKETHAQLKREKQKLQDELLELNVRTEIELSDKTVNTLTEANIL